MINRITVTIFVLGITFVSCEKDNFDIGTKAENNQKQKTITPHNKVANKSKLAVRDDNGSLTKCVATPDNCASFMTLPAPLEPSGTFFNIYGEYIVGSFDANYSDALNLFTESEVDNVISGGYTVKQEMNDGLVFVAFQSLQGEEDVAVYQYGE